MIPNRSRPSPWWAVAGIALVLWCEPSRAQDVRSDRETPARGSAVAVRADRQSQPRLPTVFRRVDQQPDGPSIEVSELSESSLPLAPRRSAPKAAASTTSRGRSVSSLVSTLALVAGVMLLLAWFARKYQSQTPTLPEEVFQHLGSAPLTGRYTVHVLRFGDKLVLATMTATGVHTLSELTNVDEVQRLSALCRSAQPSPIASKLNRVLADWSQEPELGRGVSRSSLNPAAAGRTGEATHV